jgi:hypothetical protein
MHQYELSHGPNDEMVSFWWCMLYYYQDDEQNLREKLARRIQSIEGGKGAFGHNITAFFIAWLDGTDAALPWFKKAFEIDEFNFYWPEYVYLPEAISDDPDWLAFWAQPRLAELMAIRRSNQTQEHIGHWKERPVQ